MDTLAILKIILSILYIVQRATSRCSESAVSYWKRKYESNYDGNDEPEIRCDKAGGYCLSDDGKCEGGKIHWQTTCEDKCICCFEIERRKTKDWGLMTKRKATWKDAQDFCRRKRGDLLVPKNIWDVILFLREKEIGRSDVWVGINDQWRGQFEGLYGNYIKSGWQYDQPHVAAKKKENCVIIEDEPEDPGMKVESCNAKNYFICDFSLYAKAKDRHPIFLEELDPEDSEYGPKKKYNKWENWEKYLRKPDDAPAYGRNIVIVPMHLSWMRARAECQSRGGDLHIPISIQDMIMYMREQRLGSRDVWIGYSDKYTAGVYDGIQSNKIISGWQTGQPAPMKLGDDCVVVEDDKVDGVGMKVEPCLEKHLFICDVSKEWRSHHDTTE